MRALPFPSKVAYKALCRRSKARATTPDTTSARVAARVIDSGAIGGPPVSDSAVAVGLAVAVAVPVAVAVGLAVAVEPVTVTLPIIPKDSCGMQK